MSIENPKTNMEGESKDKDLRKILENAGFRKEEAREFNIAEIEDFSKFGETSDNVDLLYGKLNEWLEIPYAFDDFGSDHEARRKWRHEFNGTEIAEEIKRSKMRTNIYGRPGIIVETLLRFWKEEESVSDEFIKKVKNIWQPATEIISELQKTSDSEERKELIEKIEDTVVEVMNAIANYAKTE